LHRVVDGTAGASRDFDFLVFSLDPHPNGVGVGKKLGESSYALG
jgi:hypothetical protein